jgi:hypothetical protein
MIYVIVWRNSYYTFSKLVERLVALTNLHVPEIPLDRFVCPEVADLYMYDIWKAIKESALRKTFGDPQQYENLVEALIDREGDRFVVCQEAQNLAKRRHKYYEGLCVIIREDGSLGFIKYIPTATRRMLESKGVL